MNFSLTKEPKVSIIIPIYNMEIFLVRCLQSILSQTYHNLEIILIDDGSHDNSLNICNSYKAKDDRVFVFRETNQGSGPARNLGINNAHGEFIVFVDPDDWLPQNSISLLISKQEQGNYDFVIGESLDCLENQKKSNPNSIKDFNFDFKSDCRKNFWNILNKDLLNAPWRKLYRKSLIINNNVSFPNLRRSQDLFFNLDYFDCISSIAYFNAIVYFYNVDYVDPKKLILKLPANYYETLIKYYKNVKQLTKSWKITEDQTNESIFCTHLFGLINASMFANYLTHTSNDSIIHSQQIREIVICSNPKGVFKKSLRRAILTNNHRKLNALMKFKKLIRNFI